MSLDSNQRAVEKVFPVLFQNQTHVFANALGTHIIQPELDDAGQGSAALKKQPGEIEILGENHGVILTSPAHNLRVRGVGRTQFAPVASDVTMLAEKIEPRKREAVVNDHGHAG